MNGPIRTKYHYHAGELELALYGSANIVHDRFHDNGGLTLAVPVYRDCRVKGRSNEVDDKLLRKLEKFCAISLRRSIDTNLFVNSENASIQVCPDRVLF